MTRRKESKSKADILKNIDLQEALNYNRFHHFLLKTKKYKDIYWSKEALITLLLSFLMTFLMIKSALYSENEAIELASTIIPIFIGGMLTILGLSLAGLAIVSGTLGAKFLTTLIKKGRLYSILSILFSFYFAGFVIGVTLVLLTICYIVLSFKTQFDWYAYVILTFFASYLVFFSIIYSTMLLGTCIRIFLVKYAIEKSSI